MFEREVRDAGFVKRCGVDAEPPGALRYPGYLPR